MKRYSNNEKPYIYVFYPQEREEDILNTLEQLNKEGIEFWYSDKFNKKEIKRIQGSFGVLLFVTNKFSKSEEFHSVINKAIEFNQNIMCVYLEDIDKTPWFNMQLGFQQSLKTKDLNEKFVEKLKESFIFKDMKVTAAQKIFQRNKALVAVLVPIIAAVILFVTVINPLLIAPKEEQIDVNSAAKVWGLTESKLKTVKEIHILGDKSYLYEINAENYVQGTNKTYVQFSTCENIFWRDGGTAHIGTLTSEDLEIIQYMPNLEVLDIEAQMITDISSLSNPNLRVLKLNCNPIKSLEGIENLPQLRTLVLTGTEIEDISLVKNLKYLTELRIDNTNVKNIDALKDLAYLSKLNLDNTKIKDVNGLPNRDKGYDFTLSLQLDHKLEDLSGLANIKNYSQLMINSVGDKAYAEKIVNSLKDSEVSDILINECSSVEKVKELNITDWGQVDFLNNHFTSLEGIEELNGVAFLKLSRNMNSENYLNDLRPLLKLESLQVLYLSPDMEALARAQLKNASFSIVYEWR